MNDSVLLGKTWSLAPALTVPTDRRIGWLERAARSRLFARLERIVWGRLEIRDALGTAQFGPGHPGDAPTIVLEVRDPAFYLDVAARGSVGAGEAYIQGRWDADDLVGLARLLVRNREVLSNLERGMARVGLAALRWWHARRDNTPERARANIAAHYDLGNEFYALFLDESRMYSSAIFAHDEMTLEQAQEVRLERICEKLDLGPDDHLLEIGTGWGGMAIHAARSRGCRVTTTTISREQHDFAVARVRELGLEGRVEVLFEDYRALTGRYDKLVSLEMVEAVGERWFDTYFAKCSDLLRPDGMMLLQAITIRDQYYEEALRSVDFIQRRVFPGSCIPSIAALTDRVARVTDLYLMQLEDIGPHYARTLHEWRSRFHARIEEARALGCSEAFLRLWDFYLSYCEGGFRERAIGDVQMLLAKPLCRRDSFVPPLSGGARG